MVVPLVGARNSRDGGRAALVGACSRPGARNWPVGGRVGVVTSWAGARVGAWPSRPGAVITCGPLRAGAPEGAFASVGGATAPGLTAPGLSAGCALGVTPLGISLVSLGTLAGGGNALGLANWRPTVAGLATRCTGNLSPFLTAEGMASRMKGCRCKTFCGGRTLRILVILTFLVKLLIWVILMLVTRETKPNRGPKQ